MGTGGTVEAINESALGFGMKTLKDHSVWLLENGWTTTDEVLRVVAVHE